MWAGSQWCGVETSTLPSVCTREVRSTDVLSMAKPQPHVSPAPDPQLSFARLVYPLKYYHSPGIVTLLFCAVSCVLKKQGKLCMEFVKERRSTHVYGLVWTLNNEAYASRCVLSLYRSDSLIYRMCLV